MQKSKRKEEEGGRGAVRRDLQQEDLYLDRAQVSLVGFTVGSHMMAPNTLNTRTTAELE